MRISALILAGGKSSRMGADKGLLEINGIPLIQHIARQLLLIADEILISTNAPEKYTFTGFTLVQDEQPDVGPLMGIMSGLRKAHHDTVFVTACDIPEIPIDYIQSMFEQTNNASIVMPKNSDGTVEPLFAFYSRNLIPVIEAVIARGGRKITELFKESSVCTVFLPMPECNWYKNLNTPEDYKSYIEAKCYDY